MIAKLSSSNSFKPTQKLDVLSLQHARWLMLSGLLALPAYAYQANSQLVHRHSEMSASEPNAKPVLTAQRVVKPDPISGNPSQGDGVFVAPPPQPSLIPKGGVTQGEGAAPPRIQVTNTAQPAAAPVPVIKPVAPPASIPAPGAGNVEAPMHIAGSSPPIKGGPGPGNGPQKPTMPGAGSSPEPNLTARTMVPSSPTPGAGPSIASPSVASPAQPAGAMTTNSAPSMPAVVTQPVPPMQGNPAAQTQPAGPAMVASLSPSNTPVASGIVEILPSVQKLSESMRELPTMQQQGGDKAPFIAANSDRCISVSLRPDTQRAGLSLVDLTGDGLIVSAVPDAHIQAVFAKAGYGQVDLSQAARWCVTQTAARALVRPSAGAGVQQAALLVQTGAGLQLMSQDQWAAHQLSAKPPAMAAVVTKSSKLTKPVNRLVAKRSGKPPAGVAVSVLRLPAGNNKTGAGA